MTEFTVTNISWFTASRNLPPNHRKQKRKEILNEFS